MNQLSVFIRKYWKSVLVTLVILYLSFMSPPKIQSLQDVKFTDKYAHLLVYSFFAIVLIRDILGKGMKIAGKKFYFYGILYPVLLGGLIEILQTTFFPPRTAEWLDWAADITGVLIGWATYSLYTLIKK